MDETADDSLILGTGSPADYDAVTGGSLAAAQDPFSSADEGTLNSSNTGTGGAPATNAVAAPSSGSSSTPPFWLSSLFGAASSAATTANTTAATIIGGKPAVSPTQAGQSTLPTTRTVTIAGQTFSLWEILFFGGAAALVLWLFHKK